MILTEKILLETQHQLYIRKTINYLADLAMIQESISKDHDKNESLSYHEKCGIKELSDDDESLGWLALSSPLSMAVAAKNDKEQQSLAGQRLSTMEYDDFITGVGFVGPIKPYLNKSASVISPSFFFGMNDIICDILISKYVLSYCLKNRSNPFKRIKRYMGAHGFIMKVGMACCVVGESVGACKGYLAGKAERSLSTSIGSLKNQNMAKNRKKDFLEVVQREGFEKSDRIEVDRDIIEGFFKDARLISESSRVRYRKFAEEIIGKKIKMK